MTNGEKIIEIFPDINIYEHGSTYSINNEYHFNASWWNAEYKEPTNTIDYRRAFKIACDLLNGDILYGVDTDKIYELMMQKDGVVSSSSYEEYILNHLQELDQGQYTSESVISNKSEIPTDSTTKNDLAQERYQDLIDYFGDKEVAKTILEDRKEFKAWLERLRWNVKRVDELARELEQIKGTIKDDLGVDAVSRKAVINQIFYSTDNNGDVVLGSALRERIEKLPSVTPQLSSGLEKNSKKLEKNFGELDCIPRVKIIDYLCKHCPDDGECFEDCDEIKHLRNMPSVTPQEPRKGHWIPTYGNVKCSVCGSIKDSREVGKATHYCDFCGAKMESEGV